MFEAGDTKITKIQPPIQRDHKKPTISFIKTFISSEFHVLVDGSTQSPKPETFESSLTHFPSQLAFNPFPSLFYSASKYSLILHPPQQSCCCRLVLYFVIFPPKTLHPNKKGQNYPVTPLPVQPLEGWAQFCQNFDYIFPHQELKILIFIENSWV